MRHTKKSVVLGTVLALSLAVIIAVAAVIPAFAHEKPSGQTLYSKGGGDVTLQLPLGTGALATRPTALRIFADIYDKRSEGGAADSIVVYMWALNRFWPVAYISDNDEHNNLIKATWVNSLVWHPTAAPNVFKVEDEELEVCKRGDIVTVNLTVARAIKFGDVFPSFKPFNFTLQPMTLEFRGIDNAYSVPEVTASFPSGYTLTETQLSKPAWVQVEIPLWLGTQPIEFAGVLDVHGTMTYIAPPPP